MTVLQEPKSLEGNESAAKITGFNIALQEGFCFHPEIPHCGENKNVFHPKERQRKESGLPCARDCSDAEPGSDVLLKWVCDGCNPRRCFPPTKSFRAFSFSARQGLLIKKNPFSPLRKHQPAFTCFIQPPRYPQPVQSIAPASRRDPAGSSRAAAASRLGEKRERGRSEP